MPQSRDAEIGSWDTEKPYRANARFFGSEMPKYRNRSGRVGGARVGAL